MKKNIKRMILKTGLAVSVVCLMACGGNDDSLPDTQEPVASIAEPVTKLTAKETDTANELQLEWKNPTGTVAAEITYVLETGNTTPASVHTRTNGAGTTVHVLKLQVYGTYRIDVVAIDNRGKRSTKVTTTATPAKEDAPPIYEITGDKLPIADPYVLYYNGKYYAYGTRINGFEVYISEDLKHWRKNTNLALDPANSWGTKWFWAPEVYYVKSKNLFYMFYSVDEHICVATAISPEGPFVQSIKKPIVENEKGIDTSLFIDDDGTAYLYYVRFTSGNVIWVAEMNDDLQSIKTETLTKCISVESPWEKIQGTIAEGPSLLKRGNTYYLIYSANHYESQDYAVGYATASSPKGPWKKYTGNPILRRDKPAASGLVGTGHGAPFICADGSYKYIYHAHGSTTSVGPRTSYINDFNFSENGTISISGEAIKPVVVK